jgi:hypothetical protein
MVMAAKNGYVDLRKHDTEVMVRSFSHEVVRTIYRVSNWPEQLWRDADIPPRVVVRNQTGNPLGLLMGERDDVRRLVAVQKIVALDSRAHVKIPGDKNLL